MQTSFEQYAEVAMGLKACLKHMGPWSVGDLTLGLRHVGARHNAHDISDNLPGWPLTSPPAADQRLFEWLEEESRIARSAYFVPDAATVSAEAGGRVAAADIEAHTASARFQPAHYIAVDEAARLVRVVVRGTTDVHDVLTDLAGHCVAYGDSGHKVHAGFLQAGEWLLGQVAASVGRLLEAHPGYGVRLSGHSLGAGTAAVATDLLHRDPSRWPAIFSHTEPQRVSCFALAPPPIFSLAVARAARAHTTALVTGHDLVARASVANFEQLRLEVLASGWWGAFTDAAQRSAVGQRVSETLTAAGAGALTLLARAGGRNEGLDASLDSLHHLYVAPTAQPQAHEAARERAQAQISAAVGSAMDSYRASTRDVTHQALDGVAALARMRPQEWWQAAYKGVSMASAAFAAPSGGAAAAGAGGVCANSAQSSAGGAAGPAERQPATTTWGAFGAAALATASGLAGKMAQAAADAGARHDREQSACGQRGGDGQGAKRAKKQPPLGVHDLKAAVHAQHLYCPGRLLHLQRRGTADADGARVSAEGRRGSAVSGGSASSSAASNSAAGARNRKKAGLEAALAGAQQFVLVEGDPADARFEFIAVRTTMLSDHLIPTTLLALQSLRRERGGVVDMTVDEL